VRAQALLATALAGVANVTRTAADDGADFAQLSSRGAKYLARVFADVKGRPVAEVGASCQAKAIALLLEATQPADTAAAGGGGGGGGREPAADPGAVGFFTYKQHDGSVGLAPPVQPFDAGTTEAHELERAHLSLARFADSLLRAAATPPDGSGGTGGKAGKAGKGSKGSKGKGTAAVSTMTAVANGDPVDLRGLVVEHTLQAMRLGSADARQMFPKLLPHLDQSEPLAARFVAHAAQVPCWAFLAWLPQMIAQLNDPPKACDKSSLLLLFFCSSFCSETLPNRNFSRGGRTVICHSPLGVRHPKNKWRKLTIFEWFSTFRPKRRRPDRSAES
jgi:hypothetical protein